MYHVYGIHKTNVAPVLFEQLDTLNPAAYVDVKNLDEK